MTDRETVLAGYDALGSIFADRRSFGEVERTLLDRLLDPLQPTPHVLDAGCGPGQALRLFAECGARAVGCWSATGPARGPASTPTGSARASG